jgi:hypothetical protein
MTDAEFWLAIVRALRPGETDLIGNAADCALLSEVAKAAWPVGFRGVRWSFADRSAITAHPRNRPILTGRIPA